MAAGFERALEVLEERRSELRSLLPADAVVVDAHTHLGVDEDRHALTPEDPLRGMDRNGGARSLVFALNEPDRVPAYRAPNDRVMRWAAESDGRLVPFVRLSLDEEPLREAERC